MRIALLAPLWKTIPPEKYGGSELVVANLAKGLSALGQEVSTFACAGSRIPGTLVPVISRPLYDLVGGFRWDAIDAREFLSFWELGKRIKDFDVVHNHMGLHPIALAPFVSIPFLTTLHSSLSPDFPFLEAFREYPFVSISDAQRRLAPSLNYVATVYHGIEVSAFRPRLEGKGNGFAFLGALTREKGVDLAVRTAQKLGIPLTIAGAMEEKDRPFVEKEILPYVDGKQIRFIDEVTHEEKNRLLAEADALLFPSRWNEAFGLVMIEALACGTPVAALGNGAVPEVLEHGKTGLIADTEDVFFDAAARAGTLSRRTCRRGAEERFDLSVMARNYIEVYKKLIAASVTL